MTSLLSPVLLPLLFALIVVIGPSETVPAWSQTAVEIAPLPSSAVVQYDSNHRTLTVHVRSLPLRQLLNAITEQSGIRFKLFPSAQQVADQLVTRSFDQLPIERAIAQLIGRTNAAMIYSNQTDSQGREQLVLAEVQILEIGDQVAPIVATTSPTPRPVIQRPTPPVAARPPLSQKQQLAADPQYREKRAQMQAEKQQRRQEQSNSSISAQSDDETSNQSEQSGQSDHGKPSRRRNN